MHICPDCQKQIDYLLMKFDLKQSVVKSVEETFDPREEARIALTIYAVNTLGTTSVYSTECAVCLLRGVEYMVPILRTLAGNLAIRASQGYTRH